MDAVRRRLTYANVMSSLAVFLVLGGGAAFAAGQLGKSSVGSRQLKRNAVTAAKIKNGAVTGDKVKLSSLGTVPSATNAGNAGSLGGLPAAAYATVTSIRSVSVFGPGTVIPSLSDGIGQSNVSSPEKGLYCIKGLSPAPRTAVAQLAFEADFGSEIFVQVNPPFGACAGSQIAVATEKAGGGGVAEPFEMIIH